MPPRSIGGRRVPYFALRDETEARGRVSVTSPYHFRRYSYTRRGVHGWPRPGGGQKVNGLLSRPQRMHAHLTHLYARTSPFHILFNTPHAFVHISRTLGAMCGCIAPQTPFVFALMSAARRASPSAHSHTHPHARPYRENRVAGGTQWSHQRGVFSVQHLPVCYRYFDCFDSFSGWYGMVVLQVVFDFLIVFAILIV